MSLRDQAIRLRRTKWKDPQKLAEELFLILSQDSDPTTGPVSIDNGDGVPISIRNPGLVLGPTGNFRMPDMFLPVSSPNPNEIGEGGGGLPKPLPPDKPDDRNPQRKTRERTETQYARIAMSGQIISGKGNSYKVRVFPNGTAGKSQEVIVKQLQIAPNEVIPAGTWVCPIIGIKKLELIVTELLESTEGTQGYRVIGTKTDVRVVSTQYEMQVPVWLR
jgi:hypothetical protein